MKNEVPKEITLRINELNELCRNYPVEIPVSEAAKFLHVKPETLRYAIDQGKIPGAFSWRKPGSKNASFSIQTLPFYRSQVNGNL